jgi:hypothetical protein
MRTTLRPWTTGEPERFGFASLATLETYVRRRFGLNGVQARQSPGPWSSRRLLPGGEVGALRIAAWPSWRHTISQAFLFIHREARAVGGSHRAYNSPGDPVLLEATS